MKPAVEAAYHHILTGPDCRAKRWLTAWTQRNEKPPETQEEPKGPKSASDLWGKGDDEIPF